MIEGRTFIVWRTTGYKPDTWCAIPAIFCLKAPPMLEFLQFMRVNNIHCLIRPTSC